MKSEKCNKRTREENRVSIFMQLQNCRFLAIPSEWPDGKLRKAGKGITARGISQNVFLFLSYIGKSNVIGVSSSQ